MARVLALMGRSIIAAMILIMIDGDATAVAPLVLVAILVAESLFAVTAHFVAIATMSG